MAEMEKSNTMCIGWEQVRQNHLQFFFAASNPRLNSIVYSQLAVTTIDGTARHLVQVYEGTKDGHAAWNALTDWYDGPSVKSETAEAIRDKLEMLMLTSGTSASDYINKFMSYHYELSIIP